MPRGSQLERQWHLLQLIDRPEGVTVEDAAVELGCHVRTIWRDVNVLERVHFPIYPDRAGDGHRTVWRVSESFRRRLPLRLTLAEILALLMSRDLLASACATALGPALTGALDKVRGLLSRDALQLLDAMRGTVGARSVGAKLQQGAADHIAAIQQAVLDGRSLRIRHYSVQRDQETVRKVDPYHVTYYNGGLYLIAYCHLRRAVRVFAVERIRDLVTLADRFQRPAGFDAEKYLRDAWGIVRGTLVPVRVVFARAIAPYIKERLWHPSQQFRSLPDGRLEMTLAVADTEEVRRWILGWGAQAEVLQPTSMREALREEARALAERLERQGPALARVALRRAGAARTGQRRPGP